MGPRYIIEAFLGKGSTGEVYKAYDKELASPVAIKLVGPGLTELTSKIRCFNREALVAEKVSHPNILRIHEVGRINDVAFISMPYVDGEDLYRRLRRKGRLSIDESVTIARQLCGALAAAHAKAVVHCDLKPQNILIDKLDNIYVSDFGTSKLFEKDGSTDTKDRDRFLYTGDYAAPEQILGKAVDQRVDVYALGLIIYEMTTGRTPFSGFCSVDGMLKRLNEKPKLPEKSNPDLPKYIVRAIMGCLEREPEQRFQSATEVLAVLEGE